MPRWRIPRPRFSLLTLLIGVVFVSASFGLWWRWDPWTVERELQFPNHISQVGFNPNGRSFFVRTTSGIANTPLDNARPPQYALHVWDARDIQESYVLELPKYGSRCWVSYSPCGDLLRASFESGMALSALKEGVAYQECIYNATRGLKLSLPNREWPMRYVAFSDDDRRMLCAPGRQTAFILDVDTMTETPLSLPEGSVLTLPPFTLSDSAPFEFTPDGMKVVAMCSGPSDFRGLRVFSAQNGKHEVEIAGDMPAMLEIAACLSPDGSSVLLARDGACRLFDLTDGGLLVTYAADRASWAPFSPEGNRVLLWKSEASCVFDTKTGAERLRIPTHALGFSPDGKKLVRMGEAWDATDGRPLAQDPSRARGLPAGERTLVYDTGAEPARIVDVSTGRTLFTWTRSGHRVLDGTFSPDGQLLLSYAFLNPTGGLDYSETNFREVVLWARRRPEYWWGLAWLPEFWLVYFSSGALLIIAARNLRQRWAAKSETA